MLLMTLKQICRARHCVLPATLFITLFSAPVFSAGPVTNTKVFQLKLGASRLIYNPDSRGASLTVSNAQDYPILVQGKVYTEDKKAAAPFIITPPLSRLEAGQQSRLRVVRTGGNMAQDRESLYWLCVGGIPPKDTDVWVQDKDGKSSPSAVTLNLQVSAHSCIKLLVRPSAVKGNPANVAGSVAWRHQNGHLVADNPTPFYINLSAVSVGGKSVKGTEYLPPFSSRSFDLPEGASGQVQWRVITDVGGDSRIYQSSLQ